MMGIELENCWCGNSVTLEDDGPWCKRLRVHCDNPICPYYVQIDMWRHAYSENCSKKDCADMVVPAYNKFRKSHPSTLDKNEQLNELDYLKMQALEEVLLSTIKVVYDMSDVITTQFDYPYKGIMRGKMLGIAGWLNENIPDWESRVKDLRKPLTNNEL
jgi:hypothetical protein